MLVLASPLAGKSSLPVVGACRDYSVPQTCVLPYMTLSYNESNPEMAASFANQLGVNTSLPDFGSPKCAPFYYPIYSLLSTIGYTAGEEAAHRLQQGSSRWKIPYRPKQYERVLPGALPAEPRCLLQHRVLAGAAHRAGY